jgi:hypothetical protein
MGGSLLALTTVVGSYYKDGYAHLQGRSRSRSRLDGGELNPETSPG